MNMKNKGFTLVELIVTIAILATISVVVGVSLSGMLSRQDDKDLRNYYRTIEKAACAYIEVTGKTNSTITISEIISEGYLRNDLVNPETEKSILEEKDELVAIIWDNNERTCKYPKDN